MTIRILTVAQVELDDAFRWYGAISRELGDGFLSEATRAFRMIERYPNAWHPMGGNIRRCRLSRFPYGVIYAPENNDQLIIAIAHLHRAPTFWRDRLGTRDRH